LRYRLLDSDFITFAREHAQPFGVGFACVRPKFEGGQ